jgi:predicted DNA-binding transcriptional regulator AlpA
MTALSVSQVAERWLTAEQAADYVGLSLRTFREQVKAGRYPPGYEASPRRKRWDRAELDAALTGKKHRDEQPADPIMAAIHAAEKAARARRAHQG